MKQIYKMGDEIIFHDPGPELIPIFCQMNSAYCIDSVQPGGGFKPKFQHLRGKSVGIGERLFDFSVQELKEKLIEHCEAEIEEGTVFTAFDVVQTLALKHISDCSLCGWQCGVNRYDVPGQCRLALDTFNSEPFVHIAEESAINPSIVTNFSGCAFECRYCIDHALMIPNQVPKTDEKDFWASVQKLAMQGIPLNSLEFTNPTESLHAIIKLLSTAPQDFNYPVVFNCHLFGSKEFYDISGHVVDVWLVDLRYGNDTCAKSLSNVERYMEYAKIGLDELRKQNARVIVRILVLPGHVECCHVPALELLSEYKDVVWVSVLDQYVPEHEAHADNNLMRRPHRREIDTVNELVERLGFRCMDDCPDFWSP